MAAKEMRRTVGGRGAIMALMTKATFIKCVAAEVEDDDSWREAGRSGGGGGVTVWRTMAAEETQRTVGGSVVGRLDMYRTKVLLYRTMVIMARPTKVRR
jgi:hypothetical protein